MHIYTQPTIISHHTHGTIYMPITITFYTDDAFNNHVQPPRIKSDFTSTEDEGKFSM